MDRARILIERYLDSSISPEDVAELDRLLREQPAASDAFARLTRLEGALQAAFQQDGSIRQTTAALRARVASNRPAPGPSRRRAWLWLSASAAILVAIGGVLYSLWLPFASTPPPGGTIVVENGPKDAANEVDSKSIAVIAGDVRVNGQIVKKAHAGERFSVAGKQPAVLDLSDGSQATFESASEAVLYGGMAGMSQVVELLGGTGTFKVDAAEGGMQVETPVGRVYALGAEFRVHLRPQIGPNEFPFPGTKIISLNVLVTSGFVDVEVGGKTHVLQAGDDRQFFLGRGSGKALRESLSIFERGEKDLIVVNKWGAPPTKVTVPLTGSLRILIDGKPGQASDLAKGMIVMLQSFPSDDEVIGLRVEVPRIKGTLKSVSGQKLVLSLGGGKHGKVSDRIFAISPETKIEIGDESSTIAQLLVGSTVIVRLSVDQKSALQITVPQKRETERDR